jgi:hypothetical protein
LAQLRNNGKAGFLFGDFYHKRIEAGGLQR